IRRSPDAEVQPLTEWTGRRILRELADDERRKKIAGAFWRYGDAPSKALAKALRFREESLRKMPAEKKAELLASRAGAPEFEQTIETALMLYHTREANEMLARFLDRWGVPHVNGSIEVDEYQVPATNAIRSAVQEFEFDKRDVAIYLATAGLLMAGEWQASAWP